MIRPILRYGERPLHAPAEPGHASIRHLHTLIDDMIETMYAAPGIGLAAPQVGVPLRVFVVDLSVGRDPAQLIVMVNPEFVERDGMQLEEEGCLSVPGFNATVLRPARAVVTGLDRDGARADDRRHGAAGARVPARDGSPRRPPVRRSPARHQARPDRAEDPEAAALRQMVTLCAAAHRVLRHARLRGADAARADRVAPRRCRAGVAAGPAERTRPQAAADADQTAGARRPAFRCCSRQESRTKPFSRRFAICASISASSRPTARSCPDALLAIPPLGMINVHASLLPAYRGAAPVHRAVIDGVAETGVTIMRVVAELDAGPMFAPGDQADRRRRDERRGRTRPRRARRRPARRRGRAAGRGHARRKSRRTTARRPTRRRSRARKGPSTGRSRPRDPQPRARAAALAARLRAARRPPLSAPPHRVSTLPTVAAAPGTIARSRRRSPGRRDGERHAADSAAAARRATRDEQPRVSCRLPDSSGDDVRAVIAPARLAAYDVLRAVSTRRSDLPAALARARSRLPDERDRALAGEIATGTLRWQGAFDRPHRGLRPPAARHAGCRGRRHPPPDAVPAAASRSRAGVGGRQRRRAADEEGRQDERRAVRQRAAPAGQPRARPPAASAASGQAMPPARSTTSSRRCRIRDGWSSAGGRATGSRRPKRGAGSTTSRRR